MTISEIARRTGVPAKTIRYYEEIGLVRPERAANGYRDFAPEDAHKLAFVARARALGFGIADCRRLLSLWEDEGRASHDVRALAAGHLAQIQAKIAELEAMRRTLAALTDACAGDGRPACPIIDTLGGAAGDRRPT